MTPKQNTHAIFIKCKYLLLHRKTSFTRAAFKEERFLYIWLLRRRPRMIKRCFDRMLIWQSKRWYAWQVKQNHAYYIQMMMIFAIILHTHINKKRAWAVYNAMMMMLRELLLELAKKWLNITTQKVEALNSFRRIRDLHFFTHYNHVWKQKSRGCCTSI